VFLPDRPPTEAYEIYPKMYYPRFHYANPVTRLPVRYPSGVAAALAGRDSNQGSPSLPALPSLPKNVKEFTARLNELEPQIHSSIVYDAVENLIGAHGYYLDDSRADELQALFGNTSAGRPQTAVTSSTSAIHQTVQPVIQVAPDGRSATIRARLLKVDGKAGGFESGTYEGRATNRGGTWALQSLTLKQAWSSPFSRWTPVVERRR
jgi:hypothetical protein